MKTNPTKPDRGQDASIAARERKERLELRFVLFSLRSWCSFAAFLLLLLSAGSGFAAVRYVDANSTNATPPYTSWATAAASIQQAVDAAGPGDEIVVTNGIYATGGRAVGTNVLANRVAVDKPIALRSVNGPQLTIIRGEKAPGGGNGEGAIRCVYLAEGASLSGFTLTNGATRIGGGDNGGGVFCASTNAALTNCVIIGNSAGGGGGVSGGTLYNCTLTANSAGWEGGGVVFGTLYNCTLSGNVAEFYGGGAYGGTLYNCTLTRNSAATGGGAFGGTRYNCTLTGNSASRTGGGAASGRLYNCTLTGNSSEHWGGGVAAYYEWGYFACELYNCIVYFNQAPKGANYGDDPYEADSITFMYSCTTPLPRGPGNIAADPQLASTTHLSSGSPCIGAGNSAYATGVDIDGEPWANPPAMGADQAGTAIGPLRLWIDAGFTNVATNYAVSFAAFNTGPILQSVWDFGDGTLLTNQPFASHAWSAPGVYTVRLTGYNDSHPGGVMASVVVTVSGAVYYVNAASTNPVFPYASWETAARNIQEAIGAGTLPGRSVLVTNGDYRLETVEANGQNRVALTNQVVLRSVNGPGVTVIEGEANGVRCAYVGAGSVLSGFTLTKGTTPRDAGDDLIAHGGGVWCESFGVVTNCVLTGNSASGQGGGVSGGSLYHCTLTGNSAYFGAGAYRSTLNNCTLTSNSAGGEGGGAYSSTLNNCTLTDNSAWDRGGGAGFSTLNNCTLTANRANGTNSRQTGGGASDGTLNNCTLSANSAGDSGGGASGGTLNNCTLTGNSAQRGGGASGGTLNNCTVSANSAGDSGGGVSGGRLYNCTLTGNSADASGGGAAGGTLNNCIVYYNTAANAPNYAGEQWSPVLLNYCCTTPLPEPWQRGSGNITNAPLFVDYAAGDFRLRPDSPCIDAGTNLTALISTDLLGLPRAMDGNGDGIARVDMGAYEFNPYRFEPALELTADGLVFTVRGEPGKSVRIERSRDLVDWEPVGTVPIPASGQTLIDPAAATEPFLFYRAVSVP